MDVALVTGASGGIGQAIAEMLHRAGGDQLRIGLHCNGNPARAEELAKKIPNSFVVQADLTRIDAAELILSEVMKQGTPYILINNAGVSDPHEPVLHIQRSSVERMLAINFTAPFFLMQAFAKEMARNEAGHIINISSVLAHSYVLGSAAYRCTKAALEAATKQFATELGKRGIRVNAVAPGFIETPMTKAIPENLRQQVLAKVSGRLGNPEDVANAVKFLIENDFVNGEVLRIDGGMSSA